MVSSLIGRCCCWLLRASARSVCRVAALVSVMARRLGSPSYRRRFASPKGMEAAPNPLQTARIPAARIAQCLLHPGEPSDFNRCARMVSGDQAGLLGRRQPVPSSPRTPIGSAPRSGGTETIIVCMSRGGPRRRGTPTLSCYRQRRRWRENDIGAAQRDPFVIAMEKAIEPVGEARNDYSIFAALSQRLGVEEAFTQGR